MLFITHNTMSEQTISEQVEPAVSPETSKEPEGVKSPSEESTDSEQISRRKAKELERQQQLEEMEAKLASMQEAVDYAKQAKERETIESSQKQLGIESYDAEKYAEVKADLMKDGLPLEKAVKYAMIEASAPQQKEAQEEEERAEGRKGASLPPRSTHAPTGDDKLPQVDSYDAYRTMMKDLMAKYGREKGKEKIEEYNNYQDRLGRKRWK